MLLSVPFTWAMGNSPEKKPEKKQVAAEKIDELTPDEFAQLLEMMSLLQNMEMMEDYEIIDGGEDDKASPDK